jgi:nicotinic acid phosphoribosyltransferase
VLTASAAFGIGTFLTNDFKRVSDPSQTSKALNIVIKLNQLNGRDCVKLSDDAGKVSYDRQGPMYADGVAHRQGGRGAAG